MDTNDSKTSITIFFQGMIAVSFPIYDQYYINIAQPFNKVHSNVHRSQFHSKLLPILSSRAKEK